MAQFNPVPTPQEPRRIEPVAMNVASPAPLGLSVLAFATAILGCFYTGFIIPYQAAALRPAIGIMLFVAGVILVLAGMWEYRKNYMVTATIFTSYGGFLAAVGLIFVPNLGILAALSSSGDMHFALGLFFLCWTIFTGILFFGAMGTNFSLAATTGILFLAYLLLTIGELAGNNLVLVHIGGWLAIACALAAWLAALASIVSTPSAQRAFRLPLGRRIVAIE